MKLVALFALALVACAPAPSPVSPPVEQADAAQRTTCATACTNLRMLKCKLAETTPRGATCEKVCQNVQENNAGAGFSTACLSSVKSCSDIDACR